MRDAKTEAEAAFGRIDGVIHAAALPASESYQEIPTLTASGRAREFYAKVNGLAVLEEIFSETPPDFFMLFSSLSALLGGLGLPLTRQPTVSLMPPPGTVTARATRTG